MTGHGSGCASARRAGKRRLRGKGAAIPANEGGLKSARYSPWAFIRECKMRRVLLTAAAAAAALVPAAAALAADVGVSISVAQPGVYGRIDIGRFPQPAVIAPQPVIIEAPRVAVVRPQPVYLWVPPGHQRDWRKHCYKYNACGVPVYFVRNDWYEQKVMGPHREGGHGHGPGKGKGHGKGWD
jgi:hypothetical protein